MINEFLPYVLIENTLLGAPIGHWLVVIIAAFITYYLSKAITKVIVGVSSSVVKKAKRFNLSEIIRILDVPIRLYLAIWLLIVTSSSIKVSENMIAKLNLLESVVSAVALLILLWKLVDIIVELFQTYMKNRGNQGALSIGLFFSRIIKTILIAIAIVTVLDGLGVDVTTAVAALGVGGIALALGAQKTVENFVGSLTVIIDQPLRIGDFCKIGGVLGSVEAVGVRSTRIRTPDRSLVTIPNGSLSSQEIENYAYRDKFKLLTTIGLTYTTTSDQLKKVIAGLKDMLASHDYVDPDPARVIFKSYGDFSLNIEIFAYLKADDYNQFLAYQEEINFDIMKIVEDAGSDFAFPSQTIYNVDVK